MDLTTEVVLCTYNGERFVAEQLLSILRQTKRVDKISIHDDASTDGTIAAIRRLIEGIPAGDRHRLTTTVNGQTLGYARNFEQAISRATGDLIFLADQDDVWEPEKVERLMALLVREGAELVFSDGVLIEEGGGTLGGKTVLANYGLRPADVETFRASAFDWLVKRNYINGTALAVRRTSAQAALPLPCDMPHDYWLALWCALRRGVAGTAERLYRYRQHGGNQIGIGSSRLLDEALGIWRHPRAPRERELRIWQELNERVQQHASPEHRELARRKLEWLSKVVPAGRGPAARLGTVVKSALAGEYRRYSASPALLRDLVSLVKS